MKKIIICAFLIAVSYNISTAQVQRWQELRGIHFLVYYKNAEEDFANRMLERAEDYYYSITEKLGFKRYNFWRNENRVRIYIYDDVRSYQADAKQPEWSGGCVDIQGRVIRTFSAAGGFMNKVLPHELGHIIFRELVGFDNLAVPLWLEEGVATYLERPENRVYANRIVKQAIDNKEFIGLKNLINFNPRQTRDTKKIALFYAESLGAVTYLIREYGQDNFSLFCEKIRDIKDIDRAIAGVYPYENLDDFNRKWQEYLQK